MSGITLLTGLTPQAGVYKLVLLQEPLPIRGMEIIQVQVCPAPSLPQPSFNPSCEAREDDAMEYLTRQHIVSILTDHILYQWQLKIINDVAGSINTNISINIPIDIPFDIPLKYTYKWKG